MADTARDGGDAFADEAEPTVTIDEYIEGIEAEELVRYPASPSLAPRIDGFGPFEWGPIWCRARAQLCSRALSAGRENPYVGGGFGAGRRRRQGVHLRRRVPQAPGRLLLPHLRAGWSRWGVHCLQPRLPRRT